MADWGHWRLGDGVRQADRLPEALADGYFRVDERDFPAMLASLAEMGGRLPFIDQQNRTAGTWQRLFEREDLAVMAEILAIRTAPLERDFHDALHRSPADAERMLQGVALRVDGWLRRLGRLPARPAVELHRRLAELAAVRLGPALAVLPSQPSLAALDPAWSRAAATVSREEPPGRAADDPREALRTAFSALISGIRLLQSFAPGYFAESLGRAGHEPAFALMLAFLRLLGDVQGHLNGFTRRHTDFFYRDVLGTRQRAARPEQVLLAFPDASALEAVPIRRETPVLAATADGAPPVLFRADSDAFASAVRIGALHTLHFQRDPLLSPQREMDFVTRIHRHCLPVAPPAEPAPASWSLFGKDAAGAAESQPAPMGLVLTTPLLYLREGRRRIELQLSLRPLGGRSGAGVGAVLEAAQCEAWLRADPGLLSACGLGDAPEAAAAIIAGSEAAKRTVQPLHAALFPDDPLYLVFALALIRIARPQQPRGFSAPFGRVMARLLLEPDRRLPPDLTAAAEALVAELADTADKVLEDGIASESGPAIRALLGESRVYQYAKYLGDALTLDLSTADGWYRVPDLGVAPLETEAAAAGRTGLRLTCELPPEAPAIVAPPQPSRPGRPAAPAARLLLAPGATLCAYSLLAPFVLEEVEASVAVKGVRNLKAYNELGPVDPSKPFQPFGPAPRNGASFVIGAYEPALKRVESVDLRLVWSGLPQTPGGFPAYYKAYGDAWAEATFGAEVDWLAGGEWVPAGGGPAMPLFGTADAASPVPAAQSLSIAVPGAADPLPPALMPADFRYDLSAQGGFARLRLAGPPGAFGHDTYPLLLARAVGRFYRWRRPEPVHPPYTPLLAGVELDYTARTLIRVTQVPREHAYRQAEFIDHIVPFGMEEIHPVPLQPEPGPLSRRAADGALYIGLTGTGPGKPVSLLFRMAERARRRRRFDAPAAAWSYLADGVWRPLPSDAVQADTTSGLMRSGLVTLTLPDDAAAAFAQGAGSGPAVPAAGYWLRVLTDADPATFPRVARLLANGFTASRVVADAAEHPPLPESMSWRLETTPPGLGAIAPVQAPAGGHPPETATQFHARVSERLRHRGRAVTLWDYERLVLDLFPQVERVKCFPVMDDDRPGTVVPGKVLLVAVPHGAAGGAERFGERRMLDALTLSEIRSELSRLAPAGATVEVRNAAYDMVQVRGQVRFADEADRGLLLRTLVADIAAYLSPWDDRGQRLGFGWRLNAADVQAFIAERAYVRHVSEFAMLMLSADDRNRYRLADTAYPDQTAPGGVQGRSDAAAPAGSRGLSHSVPWSLPLPLHWQALTAVQTDERRPARPAGVGMLGVGATLVATGQDE